MKNSAFELSVTWPQISLQANREAVVEGCTGILEYDDDSILIETKTMRLRFWGSDLNVCCLNPEHIQITGLFSRIEFVS